MIRALLMISFWAITMPFAALVGFPWTFLFGDVSLLYRMVTWGARNGVWLTGVRVEVLGREQIDPSQTFIFMSNHASNLDPPLLVPELPVRTSVMVKKGLFRIPILGTTMKLGSLVPVDRSNRDAGISAVRAAVEVVKAGISMTIFVEGKRSTDGKLLPFKKGPFYLAEECGVPIVPVTIVGTHGAMPKGKFAVQPGKVKVIFHPPIPPAEFADREALMARVWSLINGALPEPYRAEAGSPPAKS